MAGTRPFVGRQLELAQLLDRLEAARGGRGGVLLVSGPAGIGKTRLVEEALGRSTAATGRGVCSDDRAAPPLWPWSRALATVARVTGDPPPALWPDGAGTAEPATVATARFRALTEATDAVLRAAAGRPVLLVLEDLHWADAESLELLRRIADEAAGAALLVVGTHRDVLPAEVAAALADVRRAPGAGAVALPPLSPAEVGEYVGDPRRGVEVHRRTGGLPLLVAADGSDLGVVVAGLLARLSPPDRAVVEVAALLGGTADAATLAEVAGADAPAVAAGLRAGRRAGLLGPPAEDGVRFSHALLRDGVRASVDPALAAARHRRAAEALGRRVPADPALAGEVAAHLRAAGDPAAAARFSRLAAEHAGRELALDDAVRHLRDALAAPPPGDAERAELLLGLATAEFRAGRLLDSLARCEAAAAAAERAGRPDLLAAAALVLNGVTNEHLVAVVPELCARALATGPPPAVRARLLAQLATMAAEAGHPGEAAARAAEALAVAEQDGDPVAVLDAVQAREITLLGADQAAERLRLGRLAAERGVECGRPFTAVLGAGWQLRAGYELARLDAADDAFRLMERMAGRSGQPLARWHLVRATAARALLEGRFDLAREANHESHALARSLGDVVAVGMYYAHAARLGRLRGDPAELPPEVGAVLAGSPPIPLIRVNAANVLLLTGRRDEAYQVYDELRAGLAGFVEDFRWLALLLDLSDLAVAFADAATAGVVLDRLAPYRDCAGSLGIHTAYFSGSPLYDLGRLSAVAGRPAEAAALLRQAVDRNLAVRARPCVALSRLELAAVLAGTGPAPAATPARPTAGTPATPARATAGTPAGTARSTAADLAEAATLVRQAADEFRRLDMPGPLARADRLAGELAAARRHADPLTDREREVAALVVRALSNRDIATALVLSERTVESHVRSILAKSGVTNRAELIALRAPGRGGH